MGKQYWRKRLHQDLDELLKEQPLPVEHWHKTCWQVVEQVKGVEQCIRKAHPSWFFGDIVQFQFDRTTPAVYTPQTSGNVWNQLRRRMYMHQVYLYPRVETKIIQSGFLDIPSRETHLVIWHTMHLTIMCYGVPLIEAYCWPGWRVNDRALFVLEVQKIGHEWFKIDELPDCVFFALYGSNGQILTTSPSIAYTFLCKEIQKKMQENN